MEVEVETVVEAIGHRWRGSSLCRWCAGDEACVAADRGMPSAVVASIERRRPFIGGDDMIRGRKKAREDRAGARGGVRTAATRARGAETCLGGTAPTDISPATPSPLRQSYAASFVCQ
jgi:hypothetical protein